MDRQLTAASAVILPADKWFGSAAPSTHSGWQLRRDTREADARGRPRPAKRPEGSDGKLQTVWSHLQTDMKTNFILTILISLTLSNTFGQTKNTAYKKLSDTAFNSNDVILVPGIRFPLGKCEFLKNSKDSISSIADFIKRHPTFKIEVGVHTVVRGKADTNLFLTQCRANKIFDYLTKVLMFSPDNLICKGYGDTRPIYSKKYLDNLIYQPSYNEKKLEELHEKNKRIEIKILQTK